MVQDPDGEEGFRLGGWFRRFGGEDLDEWARLLHRGSTRDRRPAARPAQRRLVRIAVAGSQRRVGRPARSLPKYVVSSTLAEAAWSNATVLRGDVVDEVAQLKRTLAGEIAVFGSYQLGRMLIEHDLIDEVRLVVFPVVLGTGERLFGETSGRHPDRPIPPEKSGQRPVSDLQTVVRGRTWVGLPRGSRVRAAAARIWQRPPATFDQYW